MGIWKNFDELEESLNLAELNMILKSKREQEDSRRHFEAAMQGVDLDKNMKDPTQQKIEEVKRRAAIKERGETEVQREEFAVLGFGYEAE